MHATKRLSEAYGKPSGVRSTIPLDRGFDRSSHDLYEIVFWDASSI